MRHFEPIDDQELIVRSNGVGFSNGHVYSATRYPGWHQLVYARQGTITVTTDVGYWVVPPQRAVFVPAGTSAKLRLHGRVTMSCLYLRANYFEVSKSCVVVSMHGLLRELVVHIVEIGMLRHNIASEQRLALVVADLLQTVAAEPLQLLIPADPRAHRVFALLEEYPDQSGSLARIAETVGTSKRTLERIIQQEMGMSFGRWRQQVRMYMALRLLADNRSVTDTALQVGYATASGFVFAFREAFGKSPGDYFRGEHA